MANSTLAIINSKNILSESISSSNFSYNIGTAIEIQELALKSVSLPINKYNNIFNFNVGGVDKTIIIPVGQYNLADLIIYIINNI